MAPNILLTGVSGYLGGTLLDEWKASGPTNHGTIYALVCSDEQAKQVQNYGAEPLIVDLKDEQAIVDAIVQRNFTVFLYIIRSYWLESQLYFMKGLAEVKGKMERMFNSSMCVFMLGSDGPMESLTDFRQTAGTKQFADCRLSNRSPNLRQRSESVRHSKAAVGSH